MSRSDTLRILIRSGRLVSIGVCAWSVGHTVTSSALPAKMLSRVGVEQAVRNLRPGQSIWAPQVSPAGPIVLIVSLPQQRAYLFRNGVLIGVSTASTGKKGHATPTGVFTILQKQIDHKSNLYSDAPMPFMQRLTWDGIALHAGNLPGFPASHGCIRLPMKFAKSLYSVTRLGLTVVITDQESIPRVAPTADLFPQEGIGDEALGEEWSWRPQRAPSGPISILVSFADRRLIVLRNGVEIGSAPVVIAPGPLETAAYSLRAIDSSGLHWLRLPLPGDPPAKPAELTRTERGRLTMPEDFRRKLAQALAPGATAIVTTDTLRSTRNGGSLTVVEAH